MIINIFSLCQIGLAAETPTVRIGSAEGSVSDTVDISINIVNASVIGAMDIGLTYDASILEATNVINGAIIESLPDALWSYNISSGKINISLATYPDAINNDGELFIVTFDVVGGNAGDNSTLVTEVEAYTMDASPQPVSMDTEDGVVVVTVKRSGGSSSGSSDSVGVVSSGEASGNIHISETKIKTLLEGEPGGEGITAEPTAKVEKTPVPTPTEKKGMPGFGLFAGLSVLLIAVQLLRKKK